MADDLKRLSDITYSGEKLLESLLHARGDAEIDTHIGRVKRWGEDLIALGETLDPIRLRFKIVRPTSEETARIRPLYAELRDDQRAHCNYVETALGRLNAYLRRSDARPKRAGRKRGEKKYLDVAAKNEARRLQGLPNPPTLRQIALKVEPLAERGLSENANFARVYKWLRGV